ncbi:MAG: hypothetical protein LBC87_00235 [Fibromonadaceae bacterium]|jgi:hypothetical protein|nr:hypothetical protein [Fibromonadaceae bacterium]
MRTNLSKFTLTASLALAMALTLSLVACGGGGGSSNLPENKYFGKLPRIEDTWRTGNKTAKEKFEKDDSKNAYDKYKKTEAELRDKYMADSKAEAASLVGKEIPVSYTDEFKASEAGQLFEIGKVKIITNADGYCGREIPVTVKKDFTMPSPVKNYDKFNAIQIGIWDIAEDGLLISQSGIVPTFKDGELVKAGTTFTSGAGGCGNSNYAYFSGMKIHTQNEKEPEKWKEAAEKK